MKITEVTEIQCSYIETNEEYPNEYKRYSPYNWTVLLGESNEPVHNCEEIEELYQNFHNKPDHIKSLFETYFDGCYDVEPQVKDNPSTYSMGICKLDYNVNTNKLTVSLRRPGLLIGKGGRTIDKLKEWLECEIAIIEIKRF
tara:strand:+ start:25 stop:450 length:426 start_codon:yes stop_codon:yes gene_type:complete